MFSNNTPQFSFGGSAFSSNAHRDAALTHGFSDTITEFAWGLDGSTLFASSWDGSIEAFRGVTTVSKSIHGAPILSLDCLVGYFIILTCNSPPSFSLKN